MRKKEPGYYSIERLFETLAPYLAKQVDIRVVCVPCRSSGIFHCLRNFIFTARLRADAIHVTGDIHYCALAIRRRRCVLTVHDLGYLDRLRGMRKRVFSLTWYGLPLRWAGYVTAISYETKRQIEREFPGAARVIEVIPNCVDPVFLDYTGRAGSGGARFRVLQVGTGANKNLERVARAAAALQLHLRVIGSLNSSQLELLRSVGVEWSSAGSLSSDELVLEYRRSDALLFVSTYEGFGLPIVEAQAIGLPVITSDMAPMKDVAGGGAILVNPYDEAEIRQGLQALLSSPGLAHRLVDEGRRNVESFDVRVIAEAYSDVYRRAVSR
jgi:glycosyltransferase involved in cell wall biosynthesis